MEITASLQPAGLRRRVVLWRHGRTSWNAAGRFQGQTDIPLDEVGRAQAHKAARLLSGLHPSRIVSSDLGRARDTARYLGRLTGLPVSIDPRLRETDGGDWEGMAFADIKAAYPEDTALWERDDTSVRAGGGETRQEVAHRLREGVLAAVEGLAPGETVVVATHGGAARVGIAHLLGLPVEHWSILSGLSNCNWSVLEEVSGSSDPGSIQWKLTEHNAGTLPQPADEVED
ncbi:histidine phosphatase family protein [Arthrobacter sp. 35W]|uniref:histidine phosphatase family protein n=1 Tax=Arthrobacter sp. 35W TaxID=1132441 RepID=UPI00040B80A9|nr:histidine phosphatase family protein [Arthrobacter sp. 35W]